MQKRNCLLWPGNNQPYGARGGSRHVRFSAAPSSKTIHYTVPASLGLISVSEMKRFSTLYVNDWLQYTTTLCRCDHRQTFLRQCLFSSAAMPPPCHCSSIHLLLPPVSRLAAATAARRHRSQETASSSQAVQFQSAECNILHMESYSSRGVGFRPEAAACSNVHSTSADTARTTLSCRPDST